MKAIFFLCISLSGLQAQNDLEIKSFFGDRVSLLVPKIFVLMTDEQKKIMYSANSSGKYVYYDSTGATFLAAVLTDMKASDSDVENHLANFKNTLAQTYPGDKWIDGGFIILNNRKVGFHETISSTITKKYRQNLMFFTYIDERLLLINFSAHQEEFANWRKVAYQIMNSLVVSE